MIEAGAFSAIRNVASVTILIIKLVIGTSFEPPIQPYLLTPAYFKHSRKGNQENETWSDSNVVLWAGQCPQGSKTEVAALRRDGCFAPVNRHRQALARPRRAKRRHHSITSSASASSFAGISMSSALAVLTLMTSWNLVACMTGRSAAFLPLRISQA